MIRLIPISGSKCIYSHCSTISGDVIELIRAIVLHAPNAKLLTTVGNSSVVIVKTVQSAAEIPSLIKPREMTPRNS
jgi:hypothetical protein